MRQYLLQGMPDVQLSFRIQFPHFIKSSKWWVYVVYGRIPIINNRTFAPLSPQRLPLRVRPRGRDGGQQDSAGQEVDLHAPISHFRGA
jgi:hypothetical protein